MTYMLASAAITARPNDDISKIPNDATLDHSRTVYEQDATEGLPLLAMPALVLENQNHHACDDE